MRTIAPGKGADGHNAWQRLIGGAIGASILLFFALRVQVSQAISVSSSKLGSGFGLIAQPCQF